ncbi:MAG: GtrA family protein [bacterium]|nr:GtrA family protein [bacterium]
MREVPLIQWMKKYEQVFKFLIAGGIAFAVNIVTLYVLTDIVRIYYLVSTVIAFLVTLNVNFLLQKFWTFKEYSRDNLHVQLPLYLGMQLINLGLNASLMYMFVEYLHVWYILSQTIITLMLSAVTFFINKLYIFKPR